MQENFWTEGCVTLLLALNAVLDWKKKEVSLLSLAVFAAAGAGMNLAWKFQSLGEVAAGAGMGLWMLAAALLTRGAIGFGDGLLLCVTGIFLGGAGNLTLLLWGSALCALILGAGVLAGKAQWKQRFPFVPFLLLAQVLRLLVNG